MRIADTPPPLPEQIPPAADIHATPTEATQPPRGEGRELAAARDTARAMIEQTTREREIEARVAIVRQERDTAQARLAEVERDLARVSETASTHQHAIAQLRERFALEMERDRLQREMRRTEEAEAREREDARRERELASATRREMEIQQIAEECGELEARVKTAGEAVLWRSIQVGGGWGAIGATVLAALTPSGAPDWRWIVATLPALAPFLPHFLRETGTESVSRDSPAEVTRLTARRETLRGQLAGLEAQRIAPLPTGASALAVAIATYQVAKALGLGTEPDKQIQPRQHGQRERRTSSQRTAARRARHTAR